MDRVGGGPVEKWMDQQLVDLEAAEVRRGEGALEVQLHALDRALERAGHGGVHAEDGRLGVEGDLLRALRHVHVEHGLLEGEAADRERTDLDVCGDLERIGEDGGTDVDGEVHHGPVEVEREALPIR